ncbi:glycosyltransferase family 9 protein [Dictyobacter formicarum]|uniref:ADP-heptose--LPS heptosyltransferase n=1 Tax=Dictyobacter formicarum TaxID=2778368 RepID=A0ABQ3VMI4_9CHLR|nr:glycosyltransferase family 9 protein [Dictyobacter formicarum]GHO86813.1 hypothetical protein KSZ_48190 [Dictyobacter formicarum]
MEVYDLAFISKLARNPNYVLSSQEKLSLQANQRALRQASSIIILLGGKAGRLGECVVGTALLEGTLQMLLSLHKENIPVQILIDQSSVTLFDISSYQQAYWPEISMQLMETPLTADDLISMRSATDADQETLVLDFHGAHDNMPTHTQRSTTAGTLTVLDNLFRVGIRYYAWRGPERRYADFLCELFALPTSTLTGSTTQPCIRLTSADEQRYQQIQHSISLASDSILIVCFFQSVVLAKCYELWDEVMQMLCEYAAHNMPGKKISFVLACGPDENLPEGFKKADMIDWLQHFSGVQDNAHVHFYSTETLRDLAILSSHATLALSDDTGPGHISGALHIPTIVPFLPGNIYARIIWSSTFWHHGVTLDPNPYSDQQIEAAVIWGKTDIIDSIPPASLYQEAVRVFENPPLRAFGP